MGPYEWHRLTFAAATAAAAALQILPDVMSFVQANSSAFGGSGQMYDLWYVVMAVRSPAGLFAVLLDSDMQGAGGKHC
jgi:hypothetical protein